MNRPVLLRRWILILSLGVILPTTRACWADETAPADPRSVDSATKLLRTGKLDAALAEIDKAIADAPRDAAAHVLRAQIQSARSQYAKAVDDYGEAIRLAPEQDELYYRRGRENFKAGKMAASVADFDEYVRRRPKQASRQWERGIALYYADRPKDGAAQFVLYQTYHDNDVENSVWRYLCQARVDGTKAARAAMLPIRNDPRVPMIDIYEMFRGNRQPDEVLAAAEAGKPTEAQLHQRRFYAHLYVGLFYASQGNAELARKHILLAAEKYPIDHYMSDVARVHAARLKSAAKTPQPAKASQRARKTSP